MCNMLTPSHKPTCTWKNEKLKITIQSVLFVHMAIWWGQWKFTIVSILKGYGHVI